MYSIFLLFSQQRAGLSTNHEDEWAQRGVNKYDKMYDVHDKVRKEPHVVE
jgi:hypothetical protein